MKDLSRLEFAVIIITSIAFGNSLFDPGAALLAVPLIGIALSYILLYIKNDGGISW